MVRKLLLLTIFILPIFITRTVHLIYAQTNGSSTSFQKTNIVVFIRAGCLHCENEEKFLDDLENKRQDIEVTKYRLENERDRRVWEDFTTKVGISKVTPITVVGLNYIIGFDRPETTGKEILSLIEKAKEADTATNLENVTEQSGTSLTSTCDEYGLVPCSANPSFYVSLPLIGKINTQKYPLLILSAMLGFFDGFNPCAMWVLITFLIILLQVGNRKKMFLFAGTFIVAEAVMYSFILTVWYKTWDFVKLDNIITPIVGIAAIIGGIFFLNEWRKKEIECKVTNLNQRQKTKQRIENLAANPFTLFTFLAILGVAFSVNIIEFACSIGIPQAFTKILELNQLSLLQTASFIFVYIVFYMIDDFIVFGIALYGMDKLSFATKYSKLSNLLGGAVMVLLGLLMIFKPDILMF